MKLKDTGLTAEELKGLVKKYMIETYERFDFIAETAKDMYLYDEKGNAYLDFYAGIAVNSAGNCNEKVVKVTGCRSYPHIQLSLYYSTGAACKEDLRHYRNGQDLLPELRY